MKFYEVSVLPASGGSDEYQCAPIDGEGWSDAFDLLHEIEGTLCTDVFELIGDLPDGLEDIRGRIHDEPAAVYGWLDGSGAPHYFGIEGVD